MKDKEVWFECPVCHRPYFNFVQAQIKRKTGGLLPICELCGSNLIRRVKKVAKQNRFS